jgi:hypothetical protein
VTDVTFVLYTEIPLYFAGVLFGSTVLVILVMKLTEVNCGGVNFLSQLIYSKCVEFGTMKFLQYNMVPNSTVQDNCSLQIRRRRTGVPVQVAGVLSKNFFFTLRSVEY